jgi:hypothetical protein
MKFLVSRLFNLALLLSAVNCNKSCPSEKKIPPAGLAGSALSKEQAASKKERNIIHGTILEVIKKEGFSYLQIQTPTGEKEWIAILESNAALGNSVSIEEQVVLTDFHSKSVNRTFSKIIFGVLLKN